MTDKDLELFTQAVESAQPERIAGFYDEGAELRLIDHQCTPDHPREIRGREAILSFWRTVADHGGHVHLHDTMHDGNRTNFIEDCDFPDGSHVTASVISDWDGDKIVRQTMIQAWDIGEGEGRG